MATFKKTLSGDSRYSITLTVTEQTPVSTTDIALNVSRVDYTLTATKSSGGGYYTSSKTNAVKVTLGGNVIVDKKIAYDFTGSTPKTITLASGTEIIKHDSDGSKTISCSGYFKDAENSLGSATASGNLKLTQLHKAPDIEYEVSEQESFLQSIGVTNDNFVVGASRKRFSLTGIPYDDAVITAFRLSDDDYSTETDIIVNNSANLEINYQTHNMSLYSEDIDTPVFTSVTIEATDSKNGAKKLDDVRFENVTVYLYPKALQSTITTKRDGQLSGKVNLSARGTYFNGSVGNQAIHPAFKINVYEHDSSTLKFTRTLVSGEYTYSNGAWEINELAIGSERGTSQTPPSNWFNPQIMYDVVLYVSDEIVDGINTLSPKTYTSNVLIGEPIMKKYKDRVDFKRITRQKGEVYGETILYDDDTGTDGNVTLSDNASNYSYLEIFYFNESNDGRMSQKIYSPNGNTLTLNAIYDNGTNCFFFVKSYSINGTTMTAGTEFRWRIATSGNPQRATTSTNITIYRVVGYK